MDRNISNEELIAKLRSENKRALGAKRRKSFKGTVVFILIIVITSALVLWLRDYNNKRGNYEISKTAIHRHAHLLIRINGVQYPVVPNIGLDGSNVHPSHLHTHSDDGVIHMEMEGPVKARDIWLGQFFKVWDTRFSDKCILDACNEGSRRVKLLVNGRENGDFERYVMQDGDNIEIIYE